MSNQDTRYQKAKNRVEELKSICIHLTVFVLVNMMLFTINMFTSPGSAWFIWPLMGWSIGLGLHAVSVFGPWRLLGKDWEERKIHELMENDENR